MDGFKIEQNLSFIEGMIFLFCKIFSTWMNILILFKTAFTGWDTNNKYYVKNTAGMPVYNALEGF